MMHGSAFFRNFDTGKPVGESLRDLLLEETRLSNASVIPFHRDRPAADVRHHEGRDRFVIGGEFTFRDSVGREKHLLRMCDQAVSRTTSRAGLSVRSGKIRPWRSFP